MCQSFRAEGGLSVRSSRPEAGRPGHEDHRFWPEEPAWPEGRQAMTRYVAHGSDMAPKQMKTLPRMRQAGFEDVKSL